MIEVSLGTGKYVVEAKAGVFKLFRVKDLPANVRKYSPFDPVAAEDIGELVLTVSGSADGMEAIADAVQAAFEQQCQRELREAQIRAEDKALEQLNASKSGAI